jgi:hypothetical protein
MPNTLAELTPDELAEVAQFGRDKLLHACKNATFYMTSSGLVTSQNKDRTKEQVDADFWARVRITDADKCWNWSGAMAGIKGFQYGCFDVGGVKNRANQYALKSFGMPRSNRAIACHKCDNPSCCNPAHLYWGSYRNNAMDAVSRGRQNLEIGSERYNAILTEAQVAAIKRQAPYRKYGWLTATAKKYGVRHSAIWNIITGLRWKQVAPDGLPVELDSKGNSLP